LQSTRLSNQTRRYALISFIAIVIFFEIITNLRFKVILRKNPLQPNPKMKGGIFCLEDRGKEVFPIEKKGRQVNRR
jgi:hypothetical protein